MGSRHSTMFVFALFLLTSFPVYDMKSRFSSSLFFISTVFLVYVAAAVSVVLALVLHFEPRYGQTNMLVYLGICSLIGSLLVLLFSPITLMEASYLYSTSQTN